VALAISSLPLVPVTAARRLLLSAQGLLAPPEKSTADSLYALVERLGFVQIDSINIVARAHHLILGARLRGYRPSQLTTLLEGDRRLFEHWTHDAAAIPTVWFPYWWPRFARFRAELRHRAWWRKLLGPRPRKVLAEVRDRLRREGPLLTRDFAADGRGGGAGPWWGWKPHKAALEYLWATGEVAIAGRRNFHKLYDLTERVLPEACAAPRPRPEEHLAWACRSALDRLGVATAEEVATFWSAVPAAEARPWCERAAAAGEIARVRLEAADGSPPRPAYAVADWLARAAGAPGPSSRITLLAPFDPVLHDRRRTLRLFGFDYRFEAFVPAQRRRHGYYVMPILEGDRLVGRLDPKLHRREGRLEIRAVWWEPGVRPTGRRTASLEAAVGRLARALGAERWEMPVP
jgi:uncharacterized protein